MGLVALRRKSRFSQSDNNKRLETGTVRLYSKGCGAGSNPATVDEIKYTFDGRDTRRRSFVSERVFMDFLDGETIRQLLVAIISIIPANLFVQAGFDKRNPVTDLDRYSTELDLLRSISDNLQEGAEVDGTAGGGETPQGANRGIVQLGRDAQLMRSARLIADRELLEASRQNEKGFKKSLLATSLSLAALFTLLIVVSPADREWTFLLFLCSWAYW